MKAPLMKKMALLMKVMAPVMKVVLVVLVCAVRLLLVKLGLQASSKRLVFLHLRRANHGLLIVADDDLLRRSC